MTTISIPEGAGAVQFHLQSVVSEKSLEDGEYLTEVAAHNSNLYVGTSLGNVLHYVQFEDSPVYILLSRISASSTQKPVHKIVLLELIERVLILCGNVASVYSLLDLSACKLGKLKDVRTISLLSYKEELKKAANTSQKALVVGFNKVRIIQISRDLIKLVKDVNYNDALSGVSCSATSSIAYSNLVVVSNKSTYDLIDLKETKMISLFNYKSTDDADVVPHCVPFTSDTGREEFLLTIHADPATSIAMFVNSEGDVTRGTLSWIELGYPQSIAVQWPYVFAIMKDSELVVSSLESIDHKTQMKLDELQLLQLTQLVTLKDSIASEYLTTIDAGTTEVSKVEISARSNVLLVKSNEVLAIHNSNDVSVYASEFSQLMQEPLNSQEDLQKLVERAKMNLESAGDTSNAFLFHLLAYSYIILQDIVGLLQLINNDFMHKSLLDPKFFIYIYKHLFEEVNFNGLQIYLVLKEAIDKTEEGSLKRDIINEYLLLAHLHYMKQESATMSDSTKANACLVRTLIYKAVHTTSKSTIQFSQGNDVHGWTKLLDANNEILAVLRQGSSFLARIEILKNLAHQEQDIASKQSYAVESSDYSIKLLAKEVEDVDFTESDREPLLNSILELLRESFYDEKLYAKYLLHILDIDKSKGVSFIRKQKGGAFKATHKHILEEMSDKYKDRSDEIYQLKAEFAESSLRDDISDASRLEDLTTLSDALIQISSLLASSGSEADVMNFQVFQQTFCIENSLSAPDWPKLTWLDYLQANMKRSECAEYIETYLKTAELLIVNFQWLKRDSDTASKVLAILQADQFEYLRWIISGDEMLEKLLSFCDFTNAENYATYYRLALQAQPYYFAEFKTIAKEVPSESMQAKDNLIIILNHYLNFVRESNGGYAIIRKFLQRHGESHFDILDIIRIIPELFPISYLQDFLQQELLSKHALSRHVTSTKALARYELTSTAALVTSLDSDN